MRAGLRRPLVAAGLLALAAAVNTASVAHQQRTGWATRRFGRAGWNAHLLLICPPWLAFLASLHGLDRHPLPLPIPRPLRRAGWALLLAAGGLWVAAYRQLGPERTGNGYFFGRGPRAPVTGGVYARLRNPMYDSYALALAGRGLLSANAIHLILALESVLLLNVFEAGVENRPFVALREGRRDAAGGGRPGSQDRVE